MQLFAMEITFDPVKRANNLHSRQLDFLDAEIVLSSPAFTVEDTRIDYGEHRFQMVGFLAGRRNGDGGLDPAR